MKSQYNAFSKYSFLLIVMLVLSFSCKKDDSDPEYVGTWVALGTYTFEDQTVEMKRIQVFSRNSFVSTLQIKNPVGNAWLDYSSLKGTIKVSNKTMNVTITEAGVSAINPLTQYPTGTIIYVKSNETGFTDILSLFKIAPTFTCEYSILEKELTLKTDYNADSDFTDDGESMIYLRQ